MWPGCSILWLTVSRTGFTRLTVLGAASALSPVCAPDGLLHPASDPRQSSPRGIERYTARQALVLMLHRGSGGGAVLFLRPHRHGKRPAGRPRRRERAAGFPSRGGPA